jgi:predicted Zn-dependent protease with MMP-like domain
MELIIMPRYRLSRSEFEGFVNNALIDLPDEFQTYLDNVVIVIEDEPPKDMTDVMGVYEGVPLTDRSIDDTLLPDTIALYKGPIERVCSTPSDFEKEIRKTVLHEIGHLLGLEEEQLDHL